MKIKAKKAPAKKAVAKKKAVSVSKKASPKITPANKAASRDQPLILTVRNMTTKIMVLLKLIMLIPLRT